MNGVRLEPGMSIQVVNSTSANPVISNPALVEQVFQNQWGVSLKKACAMSMADLDVERIG